jgi:tetratricopeptide (TPR) repeat protein
VAQTDPLKPAIAANLMAEFGSDSATEQPSRSTHFDLVLQMLEAGIQAQRNGTMGQLVHRHQRAARWLMRRQWRVVVGTCGDVMSNEPVPKVANLLLRWLVTQLRPDSGPDFAAIGDDAWLNLPSWRPVLAMASQLNLVQVPDYPHRYRRRLGEPPLDNLCGLWGVDASTLYRALEKARQVMAFTLTESQSDAKRRLSLRGWVTACVYDQLGLNTDEQRSCWHLRQQVTISPAGDPASALWHCWQAGDTRRLIQVVREHAATLAVEPETDAIVERLARSELSRRDQFDLHLSRAELAKTRNLPAGELRAYEQAREIAQTSQDRLLLGVVLSALGKFYEQRDADRAFACYQDSADFLRDLDPQTSDPQVLEHVVTTFVRLAWLYLLRNDERSKAVLDRAEMLRMEHRVPDKVLGMLEQVWGEYWHRAGNPNRSLEHRYRALNIFERLGDRRSALAAYANIGLDLATRGDHDRAVEYLQRIPAAARRDQVDPELLVSALLNIGAAYFWKHELDRAIDEYREALAKSTECKLWLDAFRARYNLAEAHYTRFRNHADPRDEQAGDRYVSDALAASSSEISAAGMDSVRRLKSELLDLAKEPEPYRLLPNESAIHLDELSEIHRQRDILAVPADPESHAQAHLVIARAYATIAAKEREAALALIQRAGLQERFSTDFTELQQTFERGLTREQRVANVWKQQASDLLDDARRAGLIAHLQRDGAINKSRYAELGAVSPATASKHLAMLTERGLLVQQGKGPSTRYQLPQQ